MTDKVTLDFNVSGVPSSNGFATSAVSASAAVPANTELLAVTATTPTHFRVGVGAQTAVTITDPMLVPGSPIVFIRLNSNLSYTIAAVAATAGVFNFCKAYEA